jgi:tetratricopeptide (TPR) repeat protein
MKRVFKLLLVLTIVLFSGFRLLAQDNNATTDLIKQGELLQSQSKYDDAIAKFNEVLKTDPENANANYELAYSLYSSKKADAAIPYLEKVIKSTHAGLVVSAYCMLGNIYDDGHQAQKAIDAYNQGIKIGPDYPQIFYNLGLAYFRNQQFAEAEASAIEAIKHNPKNASSQRLYGLVCFHQNKRANALLAFCSFILLEPNTQRSTEAYNNIQSILKGGVLKDNNGKSVVQVSAQDDKETGTLNLGISTVALSGQSKKLEGAALLEYELKSIFELSGQLAEKKTDKNFFDKFFAAYFSKLAESNNMPAFTHTITLTINKEESAKWGKEHAAEINALAEWIGKMDRSF